jgi:hypothetical protein
MRRVPSLNVVALLCTMLSRVSSELSMLVLSKRFPSLLHILFGPDPDQHLAGDLATVRPVKPFKLLRASSYLVVVIIIAAAS